MCCSDIKDPLHTGLHLGIIKQTACAMCWPYKLINLDEKLGYIEHSLKLFPLNFLEHLLHLEHKFSSILVRF